MMLANWIYYSTQLVYVCIWIFKIPKSILFIYLFIYIYMYIYIYSIVSSGLAEGIWSTLSPSCQGDEAWLSWLFAAKGT